MPGNQPVSRRKLLRTQTALLLASLLLVAMPVGAARQASEAAATYSLLPIYKAGDTTRLQFTVHRTSDRKKVSDLDLSDQKFNMTMTEKALSVTPEGTVTLESVVSQADGEFDAHEVELTAAMPKVVQTRDKNGLTTVKLQGGLEEVKQGVQQMFQLLNRTQRSFVPPAPVRVGETWKIAWEDKGDIEGKTKGEGALIGPETLNGQPTLKVKVDYSGTVKVPDLRRMGDKIEVTYHFTGTENVDAKTYKLIRLHGTSEDALPDNEKAKVEITLELAPDREDAHHKDTKDVKDMKDTKDTKKEQEPKEKEPRLQ